jgi:hypothetical protein
LLEKIAYNNGKAPKIRAAIKIFQLSRLASISK